MFELVLKGFSALVIAAIVMTALVSFPGTLIAALAALALVGFVSGGKK